MDTILTIIDMQNDFVTGALGTPEAREIVPKIKNYAENFDGMIYFTRDTHNRVTYLNTQEGINLPVEHCIYQTDGWQIIPELRGVKGGLCVNKDTFGSVRLALKLSTIDTRDTKIYLCGVCTDICVVSNALLFKAFMPNNEIFVLKDLCAGSTPENHVAALKTMENCQIKIIESGVEN